MLKKAWDCSKRKIVFSKESRKEDRELWLPGEGEGKWKIGNEFLLVSKISKRSCAKRDGSRNETFPIEFPPWSSCGIRVISKNQASRAHTMLVSFLSIFPCSQILSVQFEIRLTIPYRIKIDIFRWIYIYTYMWRLLHIYVRVEHHWIDTLSRI